MKEITSITELLEKYLTEEIDEIELIKSTSFRLIYEDPALKAELTTPYLKMMTEYQDSVYLAYLALSDKREDLRFLSSDEKDALLVKYKVKDGSNIIDISGIDIDFLLEFTKDMPPEYKLILFIALIGYLSIFAIKEIIKNKNEHKKDELHIKREEKLYEAIEKISEKLIDTKYQNKREEALSIPLIAYENNKLKTKEFVITSEESLKKRTRLDKKTDIIEGNFLIDGITDFTSDEITLHLIIDGEKYKVRQLKNSLNILKNKDAYSALGKIINAKLTIVKQGDHTVSSVLENVKVIEE